MEKKNKVAVIIAVYNALQYLPELLKSLSQVNDAGLEIKVYAVIDNSPDASEAYIREHASYVEIISNEENLGFVLTNEVGYDAARRWGADYVFLLNQDTIVDPDYLVTAVAAFEQKTFKGQTIGAVQSLMVLHPKTDHLNSVGNAMHFLGFGYSVGYKWPRKETRLAGVEKVQTYPSGGAVLLKTSILDEVGGLFEKKLWMYHEDVELGWRLLMAGYVTVLASASVVYHKYEFSRSIGKFDLMERNRFIVALEHYRLLTLLFIIPLWIIMEPYMLFVSLRNGWFSQRIRMYRFFVQASFWSDVRKRRHELRNIRTVGDREILKHFVSTIMYQESAINTWSVRLGNALLTGYYWFLRIIVIW